MALAVVQSHGAYGSNVNGITVGPLNITTGNLVVVDWDIYASAADFTGLTDTAGNTFVSAYFFDNGGTSSCKSRQHYVKSTTGNAANTYTFSMGGNGYPTVVITEVSGADTTAPLDLAEQTESPSTSTPSFTTAGITAQANEIVFGNYSQNQAANGSGTAAVDPTYVQQWNNVNNTGPGQTQLLLGTKIVSSLGQQTWAPLPNITSPANLCITTYKAAAGGAPVNVNLTGQAMTAAQGSLALAASKALAGQAMTAGQGTVTPGVNLSLAGQAMASQHGTLTPGVGVSLLGQQAVSGQGALAYTASVALTGQPMTAGQGVISVGNAINIALIGQAMTAGQGALSVGVSIALPGQQMQSAQGVLTFAGVPVNVNLIGQQMVMGQGFLIIRIIKPSFSTPIPGFDPSNAWTVMFNNSYLVFAGYMPLDQSLTVRFADATFARWKTISQSVMLGLQRAPDQKLFLSNLGKPFATG